MTGGRLVTLVVVVAGALNIALWGVIVVLVVLGLVSAY